MLINAVHVGGVQTMLVPALVTKRTDVPGVYIIYVIIYIICVNSRPVAGLKYVGVIRVLQWLYILNYFSTTRKFIPVLDMIFFSFLGTKRTNRF